MNWQAVLAYLREEQQIAVAAAAGIQNSPDHYWQGTRSKQERVANAYDRAVMAGLLAGAVEAGLKAEIAQNAPLARIRPRRKPVQRV